MSEPSAMVRLTSAWIYTVADHEPAPSVARDFDPGEAGSCDLAGGPLLRQPNDPIGLTSGADLTAHYPRRNVNYEDLAPILVGNEGEFTCWIESDTVWFRSRGNL
jgi:hypothetical protein